ncbi:MAG: hypothetical protein GWP91_18595 [Rhodobacterales bacterium]|nr:hypothetical protein [Rhodobacterales bacterium]
MGFGCVLIGAYLVFGGHVDDHHLDADHDLESDHDHGVIDTIGAGSEVIWLPLRSMRFWTFAAACFGLTGILLTGGGIQEPLTGGISAFMGIFLGWVIARFLRTLNTDAV